MSGMPGVSQVPCAGPPSPPVRAPDGLDLAAFLPPAHAACVGALCVDDDGEGVTLAGLAEGPLRRFLAAHPGACPRAVLSLWAQWHLLVMLPPVVVALLAARRELPLGELRVVCTPDGRPTRLHLPHAGRPAGAEETAPACLLPLRRHLEALGGVLGAAGLPAPVLWGNAAAVLRWVAALLAAGGEGTPAARAAAGLAEAMAAPRWPDGAPNRLAGQVRAACGRRRTCCLRLRLPGREPCADCPCGGGRLG